MFQSISVPDIFLPKSDFLRRVARFCLCRRLRTSFLRDASGRFAQCERLGQMPEMEVTNVEHMLLIRRMRRVCAHVGLERFAS